MNERSAMRKVLLIGLVALCALAQPANSFAQGEFIDWLEGLSGPGPYKSVLTGYDVRVWCPSKGEGLADSRARKIWNCLLDDADRTRGVLSFGSSFASSGNRRLFLDDQADVRDVKERRFTTAFVYRLNRVLDVGGSFDAIRFSSDQGNAFSFWRVGFGPRVILTPLGAAKPQNRRAGSVNRVLHFQLDATYIPQGVKAQDFNNGVSRFDAGEEFQVRTSLVVDGAALLRAIHP